VRNRTPRWPVLVVVLALLGSAAMLRAQVVEGWRPGMCYQPQNVPDERSGFTFCRLQYDSVRREALGLGWSTDYPYGDRNLMLRLTEFTTTPITYWPDGEPAHAIVRATDPELFTCPFLFASDIGTSGFGPDEVQALRDYFLKGGFLWTDDFWGDRALAHWLGEMQKILPGHTFVELKPGEHGIFSTFYEVERMQQIPAIQFWRSSGGQTSERGEESRYPRLYGIEDDAGRLVVVMSHNTDIADGWEREAEDFDFFHRFSPYAYAVGINVAVWSMTR
jgi:hypothetical protein